MKRWTGFVTPEKIELVHVETNTKFNDFKSAKAFEKAYYTLPKQEENFHNLWKQTMNKVAGHNKPLN